MPRSQDASEIYTRLLLPRGHGCPLWCPDPDENLPLAYRENGVGIGDVGRVIPGGGFDPLLNICASEEDPINRDGVPVGFEPLYLEPGDVTFRSRYHDRGSHICSEPLKKRQIESDTGPTFERHLTAMRSRVGYCFTCSSTTEGAVLLMPDGASRKDLRGRKAHFRQYAIQNALRWYEFANRHLDRDVPNGSLMLVTGCDMASSWGIASFSDVSEDVEVELSFTPSYHASETLSYAYSWQTNVSATVRTSSGNGPMSAINRMNSDAQGGLWNQPVPESVQYPQYLVPAAPQNHHYVDSRGATISEVGGCQVNITSHITLPSANDAYVMPPPIDADFSQQIPPGEPRELLNQPSVTSNATSEAPVLSGTTQSQNQCVFVRGFRVSIREGIFAAAFRGPLDISSVQDATSEDIFGSKNGSAPFSPSAGASRSWFGSGSSSSTSSSQRAVDSPNSKAGGEQDPYFDVILEEISTTPEPYHPSDIINRYLLGCIPDAVVAVTHDDDWISLMREDDITIPDKQEILRRLSEKYIPATSSIPREKLPYPISGSGPDEFRGAYLQEKEINIDGLLATVVEDISGHIPDFAPDLSHETEGGGKNNHQIQRTVKVASDSCDEGPLPQAKPSCERDKRWEMLLSTTIFRRIRDVESHTLTSTLNIVLLALLITRSVFLFHGVFYEDFAIRCETVENNLLVSGTYRWRNTGPPLQTHISTSTTGRMDLYFESSTIDPISAHDVIDCKPGFEYGNMRWFMVQKERKETCTHGPIASIQVDITKAIDSSTRLPSELVLQLLMTVDLNNRGITASDPEGVWVWIGQKELDSFPLNDPFYVIPGYHQFGKVEIIEYRRIIPTFLEALGFNPIYWYEYAAKIRWAQPTALHDSSVVRVTLQLPSFKTSNIVLEYRQKTFLGALSSIVKLFVIFQAFRVLCSAKSLFCQWQRGSFGAKLMDPFGILGSLSDRLPSSRERTRRYGTDFAKDPSPA